MLTTEMCVALAREAARAPSVHNIQPARWRFTATGEVELFRDVRRTLPVGDPTGHDLHVSLGAAWEGMAIACSRHGLVLGAPAHAPTRASTQDSVSAPRLPDYAPVARATVRDGAMLDPLAPFVDARRSYRGRFIPPRTEARLALSALAAPDALLVAGAADLSTIASFHDFATWHAESDAAYHAELWSWLRLSPLHPDWSRDGLNADCLALSRVERTAARLMLRPRVFSFLSRLGVARLLVRESAQVRSAAAVVLFAPERTLTPFETGRRFYRLWLEITGAGLYAAPMSALRDWRAMREAVERDFGIGPARILANAFRVGDATTVAISPRMNARLPTA